MTDTKQPRTYEQGLKDGEDRERLRIMALARHIGHELAENGKRLYKNHGDYLEGRIREHVGGALELDLAAMLWMETDTEDLNARIAALAERIRAAGADTPEMRELQEMLRRPTRWQPEASDAE
jgi:isocitrate lyase